MSTLAYPHIEMRDGMPYVAGTRFKVVMIVLDRLIHHWDADEIQRQYPDLSLAQVYSALAYYYDNQEEMDALIARREREEKRLLAKLADPVLQAKLRALKMERPG